MEKVTMADVAREAGVSKSTVSQYLNKRYEYMADKTRAKIEEAIEKLGYQPNIIARSLKQKRTSMVGIIVGNILHYFSTEVIRAIEDFCHRHGIHAIVCNADDDPEKEKGYIEMLRARQVDGLIIFPTGRNHELYEKLQREGYPFVFVDRKVEDLDAFSVVTDNTESAYQVVRDLAGKGHENIAFVVQPLITSPRIERLAGYQKALADSGLALKEELVVEASLTEMKSNLEALFSAKEKPTALFAANDRSFLVVMDFLKEKGIKLGRDLEIVVFDNIPFGHLLEAPISFIVQPAREMGNKAAELLFAQINNEQIVSEKFVFPSRRV
ncbi:LacI family DNA-binding transcriptional regulator [Neobacillus sp. GCM10023253]|uniref:LacI family DNA-binding transcriptional regulator n=1 Tax=Neobacillus sp. GCM10023253 TaxID=3252644 RepID=UPI0036100FC6